MKLSQFPDRMNKHAYIGCSPAISYGVRKVLDNMGNPVLAAHREHMKIQNREAD
jgi:hypothetical protein